MDDLIDKLHEISLIQSTLVTESNEEILAAVDEINEKISKLFFLINDQEVCPIKLEKALSKNILHRNICKKLFIPYFMMENTPGAWYYEKIEK